VFSTPVVFFTQAVAAGIGPNREQLFGFSATFPRLPRQLDYLQRYFVYLWLLQRQLPVKSRTIVRVLAASSQVQFEVTQVNFFLADVFFYVDSYKCMG